MNTSDYRFGFRVLGPPTERRRLVDWWLAFKAHAACDPRAECERESYLSAFCFGGDFAAHLERTGTTRGFTGACWAPWLWFDLDGELRQALDAARRMVSAAVYGLGFGESDLLIFFSGCKGLHVGLPTRAWGPEPGPNFHRVARCFAARLAALAEASIDTSVYDAGRLLRAPNSKHAKTGLHKRLLDFDELLHLSPERIAALAREPRAFDVPDAVRRADGAGRLWREASDDVQQQQAEAAAARRNGERQQLNRATLAFIKGGAPVGERHRRCYSAAADLAGLGAPLPLCVALLLEPARDCGLTPSDARRAIENGWRRGKGEAIEAPAGAEFTPTEWQA